MNLIDEHEQSQQLSEDEPGYYQNWGFPNVMLAPHQTNLYNNSVNTNPN